jgi:hypothetical protein
MGPILTNIPVGACVLVDVVWSALESPRRRRRLSIAAAAVGLVIPLVYLGLHFSSPGSKGEANGPVVADTSYDEPKQVPFTPEKKRAVRKALREFIGTAVARQNLASSWDVTGPSLRSGMTREQWASGDIPVTPYPAARHGQGAWDVVNYSYPRKVGLEVLVFPKPGSGYSVATAEVDVVKGQDDRWRVDYWMITKFHGPGSAAASDSASALSEGPPKVHKLPGNKAAKRDATVESATTGSRANAMWLAVPFAVLGLIVVLPISIGIAVWLRNRRAAGEWYRPER